MRILFLVNSTYHLLITIIYKFTSFKNERVSIVISNLSPSLIFFYNNKSLERIFEKVYVADYKKNHSFLSKIVQVFFPIFSSQTLIGVHNEKFDKLFFTDYSRHSRFIFTHLKSLNKNLELLKYEDGIASYTNHPSESNKISIFEVIVNKIFNYSILNLSTFTYCVFDPSLIIFEHNYDLSIIPKMPIEDSTITFFNELFSIEKLPLIKESYIFLSESFSIDNINSNYESIIQGISKRFGNEITFKVHPRDLNFSLKFPKLKVLPKEFTSIPFEVLALLNFFNNKIIITVSSNSLIMPYLLSDSRIEGYYLYKLLEGNFRINNKNFKSFLNKFIIKYNPSLFTPASIHEIN
jgi:hypothetical protein